MLHEATVPDGHGSGFGGSVDPVGRAGEDHSCVGLAAPTGSARPAARRVHPRRDGCRADPTGASRNRRVASSKEAAALMTERGNNGGFDYVPGLVPPENKYLMITTASES